MDFQVPQVAAFSDALKGALEHAQTVKPASIEPELTKADFEQLFSEVHSIFPTSQLSPQPDNAQAADEKTTEEQKGRQNGVIETVARDLFSSLIATTSIESPEFVQVWNLFDILAALSDNEQCEPALLFWLIEELLDSQTISGCSTTFDFLESRRERITAKHWKQKQLVILRTCNELLRRLSRAEDTGFCGRVFIFMFQSFPLGDKSSVNLRGEYHTENVTAFKETPIKPEDAADKMDVDGVTSTPKEEKDSNSKSVGAKAVSFDSKDKSASEKSLDTDALYPVFWSLQQYFSQPTKLFEPQTLNKFKYSLDATLAAFETVAQSQRSSKSSDDTKDSSKKRKALEVDASDDNFNPKYLTSRDLFELEISDLFFRRHILIQAAIILDFLRSLTDTAKVRHRNIKQPNRSVMYSDQFLGEDDDKWAESMRERINHYILAGPDGPHVNRIIAAVTSRDKGWARWKMESCPQFERPSISPAEFNTARASAKRLATSKRLRPTPMGSLNLDFLKDEDEEIAMEKFKDPARYRLPDLATFKDKIAEDDLELDFAKTDTDRAQIVEAKASKTWRALRIASRIRLAAFDRIDDWQNIEAVFQEPKHADDEPQEEEGEAGRHPDDKRPIIVSGPSGVGKSALVDLLLERQPGVFSKLIQHTTRKPKAGEVDGQDYHFVDSAAFNVMLDGDQLLEFTTRDGFDYGSSRKMADLAIESGKIPLMQLDREAVQSAKENLYVARVIFISPPSREELESRLKKAGSCPDDKLPDLLKAAQEEVDQSKSDGLYDTVLVNEELEAAYKSLEEFIYGCAPTTNGANEKNGASADGDITMQDTTNRQIEQSSETNGC
ncbi:THO complex subunit 1 transcription elongation factor-domain-containing protein [Pseudomassariella vexata]|uniref:THO complex subunit 1 transcription elongation factor-domain-containing protein n=1 Tax=Pseudomassariella vexata TaxID=1141098 RepID=A0A1Y2EEH1_9PEZI|nr:THO complex subunit 1 transcription elongation factor-domain-containing protein [Pseudomassariella vexata]ORY69959.1 THO complex subunit 1 transcription elongation factor-domain-containing protein [Pseudomassariella vexata]